MSAARTAQIGALLAGLAVALGAFATHGLSGRVPAERLATFATATRYQMYHGLGLLLIAGLGGRALRAASPLLAGTLLFSGSLYLLVLTGRSWLGAVAPVGGLLLLIGWGVLTLSVAPSKRASAHQAPAQEAVSPEKRSPSSS